MFPHQETLQIPLRGTRPVAPTGKTPEMQSLDLVTYGVTYSAVICPERR